MLYPPTPLLLRGAYLLPSRRPTHLYLQPHQGIRLPWLSCPPDPETAIPSSPSLQHQPPSHMWHPSPFPHHYSLITFPERLQQLLSCPLHLENLPIPCHLPGCRCSPRGSISAPILKTTLRLVTSPKTLPPVAILSPWSRNSYPKLTIIPNTTLCPSLDTHYLSLTTTYYPGLHRLKRNLRCLGLEKASTSFPRIHLLRTSSWNLPLSLSTNP